MNKNCILLYTLLTCFLIEAQTINLIEDINSNGDSDVSLASEKSMIEFEGSLYFTADDGVNGSELWKYDGISTSLFFDINPGTSGSDCDNFFVVNNKLIFTADDGSSGIEWWVTDGTAANTKLLKDILVGSSDGVFFGRSSLEDFVVFNDKVFFAGADIERNYELWATDGTEEGTTLVKNIGFDFNDSFIVGGFPSEYAILNNQLLFTTNRGALWKTDGTEAGTVEINIDVDAGDLATLGDRVLFWNNSSIWTTDGTEEGSVQIQALTRPSTNNGNELAFTVIGDKAFFAGENSATGPELWVTDGTEEGTQLVLDADAGEDGYAPQNKVVFKDKLYYKGNDGVSGIELWTSDGTSEGTFMVKDITEGSFGSFVLPSEIYATDDSLYMSAGNAFNQKLWLSDGTEAGTEEVVVNDQGEDKPTRFFSFNEGVFFFANGNNIGREPHFIANRTLSTDDVEFDSLKVYPNPTSDFVFIDNKDQSIKSVLLTDITGKLVEKVTATEETTIEVSLLNKTNGIYFLTLNSSLFSVTKKIIKID